MKPRVSTGQWLTLSFDIIHHRAGRLDRHITGPGASPRVIDSPEGEPGQKDSSEAAGPGPSHEVREAHMEEVTHM